MLMSFSSTKLVIRAEQDQPGTEAGEVGGKQGRREGGGGGQGGEMTQTMYVHVNKWKKFKKK
jgi:hypothetical protein